MPVIIDTTSTSYAGRVFRHSSGMFFVYWYDTDGRLKMRASADGGITFQPEVPLGGSGGIITSNDISLRKAVELNGKIHFVGQNYSAGRLIHTVLVDPPNWNQSSSWKQTDESTNGFTTIGSDGLNLLPSLDSDAFGNLYAVYASADGKLKVVRRDSSFAWSTPSLVANSVGGAAFDFMDVGIAVTRNGFLHVTATDQTNSTTSGQLRYWESTVIGSIPGWAIMGWAGPLIVLDVSTPAFVIRGAIIEEADNTLVVIGFSEWSSTSHRWNYWNGFTWTEGIGSGAGSSSGISRMNFYITNYDYLARDGAKSVYTGWPLNSSSYRVAKFSSAISTWTVVKDITGLSSYYYSPQLEGRLPGSTKDAGITYVDIGTSPDTMYFDTYPVSPQDLFKPTRIVSNVRGEGTDTSIQSAIDSLPPEGGTVFIKAGTYLISSPIIIGKSNVTIEGEGMGSTIIKASTSWSPADLDGTRSLIEGVADTNTTQKDLSHVAVRNLQLDGNRRTIGTGPTAKNIKAAILMGRNGFPIGRYRVDDAEISNVMIYDCKYYGLKFEGYANSFDDTTWILNLRANIHDCVLVGSPIAVPPAPQIYTSTQTGIALGGAKSSIVRGNIVSHWGFVGIDPDGCLDLLIEGNACRNNLGGGILCEDSSLFIPPTRITVVGNICIDNPGDTNYQNSGIGVKSQGEKRATSIAIIGNVCSGNTRTNPTGSADAAGIKLDSVENSIISGNICKNNNYGIWLGTWITNGLVCHGLVISNNRCFKDGAGIQKNGLYISTSPTNNTLVGNDFSGNNGSDIGLAESTSLSTINCTPIGAYTGLVPDAPSYTTLTLDLPWTQPDGGDYVAFAIPLSSTWAPIVTVSSKSPTQVVFKFSVAGSASTEVNPDFQPS